MLGVKEPSQPVTPPMIVNGTDTEIARSPEMSYPYPYYCGGNPAVAVIQFTFKLLSSLIFIGVGTYMVMNGRKR